MTRLLIVVLLALAVWQGYGHYTSRPAEKADPQGTASVAAPIAPAAAQHEPAAPSQFKCDGRTHCSQMTSCAEATFFLKNCPSVKMDGDHDGIPCEQQFCTR